MDPLLTFFLGVVAAAFGYFLKRWWEGQSLREKIQDTTNLLRLHNEMADANVPAAALRELRNQIFDRSSIRTRNEGEILESIEKVVDREGNADASDGVVLNTQFEMNQYAYHLADLAEKEMNYLVSSLENRLDENEIIRFQKAQRAWRVFARRQAEFSSMWVFGGSMQPMVYAEELRALTIERAAKLKAEIRQRSDEAN